MLCQSLIFLTLLDTFYSSTTDKYTEFTPLLAPARPFWTQWVVFRKVRSNKWLGKLNGQMQGFNRRERKEKTYHLFPFSV